MEGLLVAVVAASTLYLTAWGATRGTAALIETARRSSRRRRVRAALAATFGVPAEQLLRHGIASVPHAVGMEVVARSEGGYRGPRGPRTRSVAHGTRRWTKVSVPVGIEGPALRVRRDARDVAGWLLGHTGDPWFDETFHIGVGAILDPRVILSPAMRRALLELPRSVESPRLTLHAGSLHLEWLGDPEPETVSLAIGAMKSVLVAA